MSDDRFTQTTLRAPRVDQDQAIATYQSGTHLLNYAYPAQHSGNATIDALLPDYNGFSAWDTAAAGTIIPYSFMDATLHYLDTRPTPMQRMPQRVAFMMQTFWS